MNYIGDITARIDVAQVVLYGFWIFFAGLVYYLHREDKREGYPLVYDGNGGRVVVQGWPEVPPPKTFRLADGSTRTVPRPEPTGLTGGTPTHHYPGSPIVPVGDPLLAGVGPGSWSNREDVPDIVFDDGTPRLLPLRCVPEMGVSHNDPDPRGYPVFGADQKRGGTVVDLWVDRSEAIFRYLEIEVPGGRRVMLPMTMARIPLGEPCVLVKSVLGEQIARAPGTAKPDVVTRLEEDRICAFYGAGTLYATPSRQEPLL